VATIVVAVAEDILDGTAHMSIRLWIVAVIGFGSGVAAADVSVTPPKGWKERTDDELVAKAKEIGSKMPNGTYAMRQFYAPKDDGALGITHFDMVPPDDTIATTTFTDKTMYHSTKNFESAGMKRIEDQPARTEKSGQFVATRTLTNGTRKLRFVVRVMPVPNGHVEIMTLSCWETGSNVCKKTLAAATLVPPAAK
jgi:hypothetical protein